MRPILAALTIAAAAFILAADLTPPAEAGHKVRYYYAPPAYYVGPPVVYDPTMVIPVPNVYYSPVYYTYPVYPRVYYPPVYAPATVYYGRPYRQVEVKYKWRPYGYKIEYDFDD